jgi:hypothetical protein
MKRLLIATAILTILGGTIWWSETHSTPEADPKAALKIVDLKDADITSLEVTPKGEPAAVAVKDASGKWALTAPTALPGDQAIIGSLVASLDSLPTASSMRTSPTEPPTAWIRR